MASSPLAPSATETPLRHWTGTLLALALFRRIDGEWKLAREVVSANEAPGGGMQDG